MLDIYDCNNYVRVKFETDTSGLPLRNLFTDAFTSAPALYIFDGANAKALRRARFPGYKVGRTPAPDNFYLHLNFFKELLLHTNNVVIEVPGFEADDVIGTYCKANPEIPKKILSTDRDFCALHHYNTETPMANLKGVDSKEVRLHKTLLGDSSDKIPGLKGFGPKAWAELTPEHKANWVGMFEHDIEKTLPWPAEELGLTKKSLIERLDYDLPLLRAFWEIIGFYDVPVELLARHTIVGVKNYELANAKLRESLQ